LLDLVFLFKEESEKALEAGVPVADLISSKGKYKIADVRMEAKYEKIIAGVRSDIQKEMSDLIKKFS